MVKVPVRADNHPNDQRDHAQPRTPVVRSWLAALVQAWREDWRATREATKVIVVLLAAMFVAWAAFALWFSLAFDF